MQQAGSSGVSSSSLKKEGETSNSMLYSPQDFLDEPQIVVPQIYRKTKRGRPPGQMDAITVSIGNDVDYNTIKFPVACDICSSVFANGTILMTHMEEDHANFIPFECVTCGKPFAKTSQLQKHMSTHGPERQFECPICFQRFSRQDSVKVHMRIHDKSQCVQCNVCEKSFLTQGALNIHHRIHRGEKPFRCHLCGKCFTQKNHVIMHIMRHSKIANAEPAKPAIPRLFQCEMCPRSFIRLSDFERHMQWTHGTVVKNIKAAPAKSSDRTSTPEVKAASEIKAFYERLNAQHSNRKMVCTIATQTDSSEEHVIIPSKYQIQAPATPRAEEDMYDNDIFDEHMDRNYSSDEDDFLAPVPFDGMTTFGTSMSAVDEAFDAVLGKPATSKACTVETQSQAGQSSAAVIEESAIESPSPDVEPSQVENSKIKENVILKELEEKDATGGSLKLMEEKDAPVQSVIAAEEKLIPAKSIQAMEKNDDQVRSVKANVEKDSPIPIVEKKVADKIKPDCNNREIKKAKVLDSERMSPIPEVEDKDVSLSNIYNRNSGNVILSRSIPKIKTSFDMTNWRGKRANRGFASRGRSKPAKMIMGLRGASHLRLMRKSLMHFISEKDDNEGEILEEMESPLEEGQFVDADDKEMLSGKRQTKVKQHGTDFLCSSKTCDICQPPAVKPQPILQPPPKVMPKVKKEMALCDYPDKSKKLLQFILSGDASSLEGTDFKLLSEVEDERQDYQTNYQKKNHRMDHQGFAGYEGDVLGEYQNDQEEGSELIEEVDFKSLCIPTFSCKLCGREFRFEGKLHRHIEAIHQRKVIYSPDVKPGGKRFKVEEADYTMEPPRKIPAPVNRELAALRSEWDDDEDNEDGSEEQSVVHKPIAPPHKYSHSKPFVSRKPFFSNRRVQRVYSSNSYPQGVKLNFNKFAGNQFTVSKMAKVKTEAATAAVPKSVSLETKCIKLLEKLFKMSLLIKCGHGVDHVSTVLGRVLQHYGVKMIEDYGQGQYEVLKYNLWRVIEWKVTMEQMEEFYTQGKSVEEMMDDIMNSRVPITAHTEPDDKTQVPANPAPVPIPIVPAVDRLLAEPLMISQMALDGNVTQLVLAQDLSPEMLQGAHIVTLDPITGQVISQVTADQVIMAGNVSEELTRHIESIDNQIVVSGNPSSSTTTIVSTLPPGSILGDDGTIHIDSSAIEGELIDIDEGKSQSPGRN